MNGKSVTALASRVPTLEDRTRVIDELLRRTLRVGDPKNPVEVATALRLRYGAEAAKLDEETTGLPVTGNAPGAYLLAAPGAPSDSPGEREYRRVQGALETDLTFLVNAPANRDYSAELAGWRSAILRQFGDGTDAARTGQDPDRRQTAFLAVRTLGDYARVARLVGVLHLEMNHAFRRLARSIDQAASVIRILIGEALYDAGLGEGGLLLEVPLVDLRQRADALVQALRVLAALDNDDADDYGAGLASYGALLEQIDRESAPELKVYLRESSLSLALDGTFDDLSSAVQRSDAEELRQIGGTLPIRIAELRRLHEIAVRAADEKQYPDTAANSSALSRFIHALRIFLDALDDPRAGARLVDLAVPLAMAAGHTGQSDGEARLMLRSLVNLRAELARQADCFLACCGSEEDDLRTQVKIDFVLCHVDRAINLYAEGQGYPGHWGPEENRAVACGFMATNLATQKLPSSQSIPLMYKAGGPPPPPAGNPLGGTELLEDLAKTLNDIGALLTKPYADEPLTILPCSPSSPNRPSDITEGRQEFVYQVMKEINQAETAWGQMAVNMAPRCLRGNRYGRELVQAGLELLTFNPRVFMPLGTALSPFRSASPEAVTAAALQKITPTAELLVARDQELMDLTKNIALVHSQMTAALSDLKNQDKLSDNETKALLDHLNTLQPFAAIKAAKVVTPAPSPPPVSSSLPASGSPPAPASPPAATSTRRIEDKDRDAVLFLLFLTSRALDEVNQHLGPEHPKAARRAWTRWLAVIRDGDDIHDLLQHVTLDVRGWTEGPQLSLRELVRVANDGLGSALDNLLDIDQSGSPTAEPEMDQGRYQAKRKLLDEVVIPSAFKLNRSPEVTP